MDSDLMAIGARGEKHDKNFLKPAAKWDRTENLSECKSVRYGVVEQWS